MLHHENGTQEVPFLFSWWSIKLAKALLHAVQKVRITAVERVVLALKRQVEEY